MLTIPPLFRSPDFLRDHIASTMAFYHPRCIDPAGGFFHAFRRDGAVDERGPRYLTSSAHFVFSYAMAAIEFRDAEYREMTRHGLAYLRDRHRDAATGGYARTLRDGLQEDPDHGSQGASLALLACAAALKAGIDEAAAWIDETWQLLETRCWDPATGQYRDQGEMALDQPNLQLCEALIVAHEATADTGHLDRAVAVADHLTRHHAALTGGKAMRCHDADGRGDSRFRIDDAAGSASAGGIASCHPIALARLLLMLDQHRPVPWLLPSARRLYDNALAQAWNEDDGSLFETITANDRSSDHATAASLLAESIVTAALLAARTGDADYWRDYEQLWSHAWKHVVDHRHGGWARIPDRTDGDCEAPDRSAMQIDYRSMESCHRLLGLLRRRPELATGTATDARMNCNVGIGLL